MLICSNCRSKQLDGTIFCSECGATLIATSHHETTASLQGYGSMDPRTIAPVTRGAPAPSAPSGPRLTLVILNSGRRVTLDIEGDVLIGRKDEGRGIIPGLDLSNEGGYEAGVSRRHAILSYKGGGYQIEDLGSANGTFVNGRQLAPQKPARLSAGDELKCGMLLLRVEAN